MKNVIKYATLLATGRYITRKELPEELTENLSSHTNIQLKNVEHERDLIRKALQECGNNKTRAAQLLGIDRKTLYNKLKIYQLDWKFRVLCECLKGLLGASGLYDGSVAK